MLPAPVRFVSPYIMMGQHLVIEKITDSIEKSDPRGLRADPFFTRALWNGFTVRRRPGVLPLLRYWFIVLHLTLLFH